MDRPDPHRALDAELLACARIQAERLVSSLPDEVDAAAVSRTNIPFKVVVLREVLIHRAAEFADVACSLFEQRRVVSACLTTRGLLEAAALICDLRDRVCNVIKGEASLSNLDDFLMRALLGSREPGAEVQAINVLTVVDRAAKRHVFFRNSYDRLSEFAHPNWWGLLGSYAEHDLEKRLVTLGREAANVPPRFGLTVLVGALEAFIYFYNDLGARVPQFIQLCEAAL